MKFQIFASFLALASSAMAEEVTQEFLEQPGIVWVSADLPATAVEGLTVSMIPYVRFADGLFESGMLSGSTFITPKSCEHALDCATLLSEGVAFEGSYTIEDNIVRSEDAQDGDVYFDRLNEHRMMVAGDAMVGGVAVLTRVGDTIVQTRPEGDRTYVALPEDMRYMAIHAVYYNGTSMYQTYDCSISALVDSLNTPVAEQTERQKQIAAYFRFADATMTASKALEALDPPLVEITRTQQEETDLEQARIESMTNMFFRLIVSDMSQKAPDITDADLEAQSLATVQDILGDFLDIAPDPEALQARFDALYPDMLLAAPLVVELSHPSDAGQPAFNSVFCGK